MVNLFYNLLPHNVSKSFRRKAFENIVGKGENAGNHFPLFPQCFLLLSNEKNSHGVHVNIKIFVWNAMMITDYNQSVVKKANVRN